MAADRIDPKPGYGVTRVRIPTMKSTTPQRRTAFDVARVAVQTIATATPTAISWNSVNFDTDGLLSIADPTKIILPSASRSASWSLLAAMTWAAGGVGNRFVSIVKNGTIQVQSIINPAVAGAQYSQPCPGLDIDPRPTDFYQVIVSHTQGAPLDIFGNFGGIIQW